ncbi:MAG TPA: glycosyltransferase family 2 protein, partial [Alphaproteobacteria bacterium]|nr:glycosyltransferase family 2 protein [Alphaproteobacteria bacterium]
MGGWHSCQGRLRPPVGRICPASMGDLRHGDLPAAPGGPSPPAYGPGRRGTGVRARDAESGDPPPGMSAHADRQESMIPSRRVRVEQANGSRVIPCLLIPIFDHASTIRRVVESLASEKLPLLIVDDGSGPSTRAVLDRIVRDFDWVEVHHHVANQGKGAALVTGYRIANERGFTHVVQLDADAQHDPDDVGRFLAEARAHPQALVLGDPIFDADAPKSRLYGRKLSVGMVWLATLSRAARDPLCGFRCVPLAPVMSLLDRISMGRHM